MFNNKEEYELAIKDLSEKFKGIYERLTILGGDLRSFLSDYTITEVNKEFFDSSYGINLASSENVAYSLADVLSGKAAHLGKSYAEVADEEIEKATALYAIELDTSTGAKVDLVIFKGSELNLEFEEDGLLKIYGIIFDMKKNHAYVDKGDFYGKTLYLYAPIPTYILGPAEGIIHGVADYTRATKWVGEDISGLSKEELEIRNRTTPIYICYDSDNSNRLVRRHEGNLIDWDLFYGIQHRGHDYTETIYKDIFKDNIRFADSEELNDIKESYKVPLVNYKYQNRETCAITCFLADKMNVDFLRLDITSERSMNSYKLGAGFTSSFDYTYVGTVLAVLPASYFQFGNDIAAADSIDYAGYSGSKKFIFYEAQTDEEYNLVVEMIKSSYRLELHENDCYEYIDEDDPRSFRSFVVKNGYKYATEVPKL